MATRNGMLVALLAGAACVAGLAVSASGRASDPGSPESPLGFTMNRLDGTPESLETYKGRVVLIVNTASKCGLTPQYLGLDAIYRERKDRGFVVLGFPANNFGDQEPGTNAQIAEFCSKNYSVSFPMYEKISVKGDDIHPLYRLLTSMPEPIGGEIQWNFDKFLVDREGKVVARFSPRTTPEDRSLLAEIDRLLAEPAR